MNIAEKITEYRAKHGISQGAMAFRVGVSYPTLNKAENGKKIGKLSAEKIKRFLEEQK